MVHFYLSFFFFPHLHNFFFTWKRKTFSTVHGSLHMLGHVHTHLLLRNRHPHPHIHIKSHYWTCFLSLSSGKILIGVVLLSRCNTK
ncbi:hypothetical protein ACE6H2_008610 [Prunus campanulata]